MRGLSNSRRWLCAKITAAALWRHPTFRVSSVEAKTLEQESLRFRMCVAAYWSKRPLRFVVRLEK
jgi:hypothetical protein